MPESTPQPAGVPSVSEDIYVLGGQGTTATSSAETVATALQDAQQPLGKVLVSACHVIFLDELASLSPAELTLCGLDPSQLQSAATLLDVPTDLQSHPILANVNLYLTQLLRFVANTHSSDLACARRSAVLGFSTGQLAASVIAASTGISSFLHHAVAVLRFAFWFGYNVHKFVSGGEHSSTNSSPWSVVLLGWSRDEVADAVGVFNDAHPNSPPVYLTAVTNESCTTVSGRPEAVSEFEATHRPSSTSASHFAHIHALYHAPVLRPTRERVLADLRRRNVQFPAYGDLRRSLRSSIDGSLIDSLHHTSGSTLVEDVLDMLLLHPVNFDKVVEGIRIDLSTKDVQSIRLVNLGPVDAVDWPPPTSVSDVISVPRQPSIAERHFQKEPIAIVGMALNFPGAPNAAELWRVLEEGVNTVSEIPSERFDVANYMRDADDTGRSLRSVRGNFLEDADVFDNAFFRVSPREARSMDPQQRVLLHVAYHALEDAGYVPKATPSFDPETFAVHVGVATNDYVQNLKDDVDVYYSTGTLQAFLSGKISYAFGFGGPSVVVDTACSSAIVAMYQACRSLQAGDCNAALAGGVNIIASPDMHVGLDRAHFLSPTGQCLPWDASADGYCRAEGCGMFVLKRLTDARAENDRILGVIRGIEVNQSGTADSITHPHVATQTRLFRKVLDSAGVRPAEVSVVEAHGTGTQAGDPAEIEALRSVFGADEERECVLRITSVKANVGHAEAASGAASLAKLVLMMRHRKIPRNISLKRLNSRIPPLEKDGLCIDTEVSAWDLPRNVGRRVALLNNFGAAGSNAALVLEEPPLLPESTAEEKQRTVVLGLSCDSVAALEELREGCLAALGDPSLDDASLADFAYTATARRQAYRYRVAAHGQSKEELCRELRAAPVVQVGEHTKKVVFLFSGQGGQYWGMGSGLYEVVPSFRQAVDLCHKKLVSWGYQGVLDMIRGVFARNDNGIGASHCLETTHCALFVLEYALARMWRSWGVHPDIVIGHSLGEYAALLCAEVISLDDALRLVAQRARADPSLVTEMLKQDAAYEGLSLACHNSDTDCVVGGHSTQLELFEMACQRSGYPCKHLDVQYAYHTSSMNPIVDGLVSLGQTIQFSAPKVPLVSTVLGGVARIGDDASFTPDYFAKHCRDPVLFRQGIQALFRHDLSARDAAWLELGPHATTSPLLRANGLTGGGVVMSTLRKGQADEDSVCRVLSQMYCAGVEVDWRSIFADLTPGAKVTDTPSYPFTKTRFWVHYSESKRPQASGPSRKPSSTISSNIIGGKCIHWPTTNGDLPALFELDIAQLSQFIDGHQVVGSPLCPASVYQELILAAGHAWCERIGLPPFASSLVLSDITYEAPLVYASHRLSTVRVEISSKGAEGGFNAQFVIHSAVSRTRGPWQSHCTGSVYADLSDSIKERLSRFQDKIQECIESLRIGARDSRTLYASTIYEGAFSRVVDYSNLFRTIKVITIRCDGADAYALAQSPTADTGQYIVHPVFMDTLLHTAGFLLNHESDADGHIFVCSHVQTVVVLPDFLRPSAMFGVYCQIGYLSQTMAIADAYAIDLEGGSGQVFAHMGKIQFRRLSVTGFKAILSMSVDESFHRLPPFPASDTPGSSTQLLSVQACILQLVARMCDIPLDHVNPESRLKYLGVDSLMSIELIGRLNDTYSSLNMDPRTLGNLERISDLVDFVEQRIFLQADASHDSGLPDDARRGSIPSATRVTAEYVKSVLAGVLDIPPEKLGDDEHLDRLGLDSLSSIEVRHALSTAYGYRIPLDVFARCKTVKDLSSVLAGCAACSRPSANPSVDLGVGTSPFLLQDSEHQTATPLVLIHDGSGMVHPYMRLGDLGRCVWGIHNPKLSTGDEWKGGIPEIAEYYASLISAALDADRPCILGGWSFGGVVAFEVARLLIESGHRVEGLLLIDSPHPQISCALPEAVIDAVVNAKVANPRHAELMRLQMRFASKALTLYDPARSPACHVEAPRTVMLRSQEAYDIDMEGCETAVFLTDRQDRNKAVEGWQRLLGAMVPIIDIPGNHFQPFEYENVNIVSQRMRQALELLEDKHFVIAGESTDS
ncbi:hypothetical protein EVJ58_g3045 [Rhodofomes roseus]|uniref:Acyl transferase domain-containing protein n=1 Tax=Rhodofomes roseus TaxID=34475 RepID=A0A4Y9YPV8_9APHY|nr:hypothetical protein EVJ58_g3045 [Rhodofomes roseus]